MPTTEKKKYAPPGSPRWLLGGFTATIFSMIYFLAPMYLLSCIVSFFVLPMRTALLISLPVLISAVLPPMHSTKVLSLLTPMQDYFEYEECFELTDDDCRNLLKSNKRFLLCFQPHGVLTFCGFCAGSNAPPDLARIHTAVASVLLHIPILKHVLGIFGMVDASKESMVRHFKRPGIDGCLVLYVGGIAELFKSCEQEERLFLSKRKGFIKLALREGVDVVPAYLFGNTSVLTLYKSGPLARLSRKTGVCLTYYWGKFGLPIPRNNKCLYARGKPLNMPHLPNPTDDDVNHWHQKYCQEVTRLFDKYKEKVPFYKHKQLYID